MKKYYTFLLLVIAFQGFAQTYPITGISILLPSSPDANTANWKSGTSLLTISATTLADNGKISASVLASKILVTIKKGGVKAYGDYTINSAPSSDFNTPSKIYRGDSAVSFIGKSFVLAPGDYEICVQFYSIGAAGPLPISEEKTKAFSIVAQTYPITGISILLPSSPDANTANWKSGTSLLTISATTLADNGKIAASVLASKILVTIKKGGVKAYGDYTINSAPSSDFNTPSKIYRGDSAVSFIGKSFVLAPGDYEICVQFYSIGAAGPVPLSEEKTRAFSIVAQTYPITGISILLPSSPDANTANWKSGTSLLTISATTLADNGKISASVLASKILVTIIKGGVKAYGDYTINSAPASDFNTPSKIYRGDSAVSFIGKSFVLAPGDYEICVQFYSIGAAGPVPISEEKTKAFSIGDYTGPTVVVTDPVVPIATTFTVGLKFNEPVTGVLAGVTVSGGKVEIYPLAGGKEYNLLVSANEQTLVTVVLSDMIKDLSANSNKFAGKTLTYSTGDFTSPQLVTWSPTDGETITGNHPTLKMTFNENMMIGAGGSLTICKLDSKTPVLTVPITAAMIVGKDVTINYTSTSGLDKSTWYYGLIDGKALKDNAGNAFIGITANSWTFKTGATFATSLDQTNIPPGFKVYPNPFVEYINVDNASELSKVIVTNIAGQVVKEVVNPTNTIQLNELSNGVYFISLYKTDHLIPENFKIVKR